MAKKSNAPKKKSKIRTLIKWARRISFVAAVAGAVRQYLVEQNDTKPPTA